MALLLLFLFTTTTSTTAAQSSICRTSCGPIPISYPFGVDPGCGHPRFHNLLSCSSSSSLLLLLRTPSGHYPVNTISYSDPHLILTDPTMSTCTPSIMTTSWAPPFALDTSTRLSLSSKNDFLFFNCSPESVLLHPKPAFCLRFPDRCDSVCDSSAYLCRNPPPCPHDHHDHSIHDHSTTTCCSYYPTASESLRMMLAHCSGGYASVYWKSTTAGDYHVPQPYDQVPEYGVRVDFEIPVTTRCSKCREKGTGGICGYDTATKGFLCLCDQDIHANVTTFCGDPLSTSEHRTPAGVIVGTTTVVSVAGLGGAGALVWYLRKTRSNKVVTCGVQTNDNRMF